jgi:hypothetical protein
MLTRISSFAATHLPQRDMSTNQNEVHGRFLSFDFCRVRSGRLISMFFMGILDDRTGNPDSCRNKYIWHGTEKSPNFRYRATIKVSEQHIICCMLHRDLYKLHGQLGELHRQCCRS